MVRFTCTDSGTVTRFMQAASIHVVGNFEEHPGDRRLDSTLPGAYGELWSLAARLLGRHRGPGRFHETSLVHETYLKLAAGEDLVFRDHGHFLATAARAMRFVLVDAARRGGAVKRNGGVQNLSLDEFPVVASTVPQAEILAIDDALSRLQSLSSRQARVVELRFFGDLSNEEISEALGISLATVKRDWRLAKAWLYREVHGCGDDER